jgi:DNA-binding LacI/PurR family transcriptional regulator
VLEAMRELDYRPNSAARALVTKRSQTLGLVSFDTTLVGPASMVYGIEGAARRAGYFVSIASVQSLDRRSVLEAVSRLREQFVEGIIAIVPQDGAMAALAEVPADIPLVGVGLGEATDVPMVGLDNVAGARAAVQHLLDFGHKSVHHISGPADWPEAQERLAGWRGVLEGAGREIPDPLIGDWSARSGYEAGLKLVKSKKVSAIFCANDHMALGVIRALTEAGRRVPGDISIVGFDDVPEAAYYTPPLTTVRQDFAELGRRGVQLVLARLRGEGFSAEPVMPQLVVRASTAPAVTRSC